MLPGDANADGTVNGADLNTVLSNYNQTGMDWWHGDFNDDGTVNGTDLNTVLSNYNQHVERRRRRARTVDLVVGGRGPRRSAGLCLEEAKVTRNLLALWEGGWCEAGERRRTSQPSSPSGEGQGNRAAPWQRRVGLTLPSPS